MKHILHVNDVAYVGTALAKEQNRRGDQAEVVGLSALGANLPSLLKVVTIPSRLGSTMRIRREIARTAPDIVHVHYVTSALWFLGIKPKLVVHAHGSDVRLSSSAIVRRSLNRWITRHASLVLYSTPDLRPYMQLYSKCAHFLPNPIDVDFFSPTGKLAPRDILLFASLSRIKGADIALVALQQIHQRYPQLKITVIDSGELAKTLTKDMPFELITPQPHKEIPNLINAHKIIVGQFGLGALGVSELEAMSCAKPTICFFEHDAAYPTPPPVLNARTPSQIVKAISLLLNDDSYRAWIGTKSRQWVVNTHSAQFVCRELDNLYEELYLEGQR